MRQWARDRFKWSR